jgi:hypothetical protein
MQRPKATDVPAGTHAIGEKKITILDEPKGVEPADRAAARAANGKRKK